MKWNRIGNICKSRIDVKGRWYLNRISKPRLRKPEYSWRRIFSAREINAHFLDKLRRMQNPGSKGITRHPSPPEKIVNSGESGYVIKAKAGDWNTLYTRFPLENVFEEQRGGSMASVGRFFPPSPLPRNSVSPKVPEKSAFYDRKLIFFGSIDRSPSGKRSMGDCWIGGKTSKSAFLPDF